MRATGWTYAALGAALIGSCALTAPLPGTASTTANAIAYSLIGVLATTAVIVGTLRHHPQRRLTWVCITAGQSTWILGNLFYLGLLALPRAAGEHVGNILYLLGNIMIVAAMWQMMFHRCRGARLASSLDATMMVTGMALVVWVLVGKPVMTGALPASGDITLGLAFVMFDITIAGSAWAVLTTPGARTPAFFLLTGAVGLQLLGDSSYLSTTVNDALGANAATLAWMVSTLLWGGAALHPSMHTLTSPGTADATGLTTSRLLVLLLAVLSGPLAAYTEASGQNHDPVVLAASVLLVLLTVARMALALRTTVVALRATEALRDAMAHQARHDGLTGLANRTEMHTRLHEALQHAQQHAQQQVQREVQREVQRSAEPCPGERTRETTPSAYPPRQAPELAGHVEGILASASRSAKPDPAAEPGVGGDMGGDMGAGVGVIAIDLDGFKQINDTLGHAAGDVALRVVAQRLQMSTRTGQDCAARLGGDEFVVVLTQMTSAEQTAQTAHRLLADITAPTSWQGHPLHIGASIGATFTAEGRSTPQTLLGEADAATYRAKADGGNRVVLCDDAAREAAHAHADIENSLRQVLQRSYNTRSAVHSSEAAPRGADKTVGPAVGPAVGQAVGHAANKAMAEGSLELHYQPVVDLRTGAVHGAEALIRWRRPGGSLVAPDDFIPVAEASDLICEVGRWVLATACTQLAVWAADPHSEPWRLAVNISARHLKHPSVVGDVTGALRAAGARAGRLVVEVTETVLVDSPAVMEHLRQLRALGVQVAIDDFGTGYTSISQLQHLPADYLKIDRSLVASEDPANTDLVRLVVGAATAFGLTVIAEGIEHEHQHRALVRAGAQLGQGWHFGRPQPADPPMTCPVAETADHPTMQVHGAAATRTAQPRDTSLGPVAPVASTF